LPLSLAWNKRICVQAEPVNKDDLKEFLTVVLLHAWLIFVFVTAYNTFGLLVEFTFRLQFILQIFSWIENIGVPTPLLGIQVLLGWVAVFIALAAAPWFFWARSKLRDSKPEGEQQSKAHDESSKL
jgi:hypothetical protein